MNVERRTGCFSFSSLQCLMGNLFVDSNDRNECPSNPSTYDMSQVVSPFQKCKVFRFEINQTNKIVVSAFWEIKGQSIQHSHWMKSIISFLHSLHDNWKTSIIQLTFRNCFHSKNHWVQLFFFFKIKNKQAKQPPNRENYLFLLI